MKVYFDGTSQHTRPSWTDAVGAPSHIQQFTLTVTAPTKVRATEMLLERGLSDYDAERAVKAMRMDRPPYFRTLKILIEAEIIDPGQEGVYLWHHGNKGDRIVRIEPNGDPTVIARMTYDNIEGIGVQPVTSPTAPRITWRAKPGSTTMLGYVNEIRLFSLVYSITGARRWGLRGSLPGLTDHANVPTFPDAKDGKRGAEEYLEWFVSKIGAAFPASEGDES